MHTPHALLVVAQLFAGILLVPWAAAQGRPVTQDAYLKAPSVDSTDQFGHGVAVSGDWMAAGAPLEDSAATGLDGDSTNNGAPEAGAVYLYHFISGSWVFETYVKASNTGAGDRFGSSIAIDGGVLVVGAPGESSSSTNSGFGQGSNDAPGAGAVYVFELLSSGGAQAWTQTAYLKAPNTEAQDGFGSAVSLGALPFGNPWIAIGAVGEDSGTGVTSDNSQSGSGAAYLFEQAGPGIWIHRAYLKAGVPGAGDRFGHSVAMQQPTNFWAGLVLVGAPSEDSAATGSNGMQSNDAAPDSGAAYLFLHFAPSAWSPILYLKAGNADSGDAFGESVAVLGNQISVGAPGEDSSSGGVNPPTQGNGLADSGAVYTYLWDPMGTWFQRAFLKASTPGAGDRFGARHIMNSSRLLVSAPAEASSSTGVNGDETSNSALASGAAYLFESSSILAWTQVAYVKASNAQAADEFSASIALSDRWVMVGATGEDSASPGVGADQQSNGSTDSGAAYSFRLGDGPFLSYCGAYLNSTGRGARMTGMGSGSLTQNDVVLTAEFLPPHSFGYFLVSRDRALHGSLPGSVGILCLMGSIGRFIGPGEIQSSGAQGRISIAVDAHAIPSPLGFVAALAGDEFHFQAWYRDNLGGALTSNFSSPLTVLFR